MDEENIKEKIQKILKYLPGNFNILEEQIDVTVQKEYLDFINTINFKKYSEDEIIKESKNLFLENVDNDIKKRNLILLAHLGTVKSYRIIEKFYNNSTDEIRKWSLLALQECRMFLQSYLTDEDQAYISSGLGGKGKKLRYFIVIISINNKPFTETHKKLIKEEFKLISKEYNSEIEEISFNKNYSSLKVLIPMDVAVGEVIEGGISKCNEIGRFISDSYFITNIKIPSEQEILEYIKDIEKQIK